MYVSSSNPVTPDIFYLADQNRDLDAQARAQAAQPLNAEITGLHLTPNLASADCCKVPSSMVMCLLSELVHSSAASTLAASSHLYMQHHSAAAAFAVLPPGCCLGVCSVALLCSRSYSVMFGATNTL